ncbi:MAG: hypothetical protein V4858_18115 [Pseudomonadota bacterium]
MPKPNTAYKRAEIQALREGELQTYLPQKNAIILTGCFAVERKNPDAPYVIQAGKLPKVAKKADLLAAQPETVFPVFLRKSPTTTNYYFVGDFRCIRQSKSRREIAQAEAKSGHYGELSCILNLEAVGEVFTPGF